MKKEYKKPFSSKSFGFLVGAVFLIFSLYPLFNSNKPNYFFLLVSLLLFLISILHQKALDIPAYYWHRLALLLHKIISPIILYIVYFFSIILVGVIMKIIGKDPIEKKYNKHTKSYWISRKNSKKDDFNLDKQF